MILPFHGENMTVSSVIKHCRLPKEQMVNIFDTPFVPLSTCDEFLIFSSECKTCRPFPLSRFFCYELRHLSVVGVLDRSYSFKKETVKFCSWYQHKWANYTLKEVQPILTFATVAKNSDWRPQWKSMRKNILNDVEELERVVCKIILQKYTWLWIDPSDILVLTVYLGMDQIFTDDPTGSKGKCRKWQKIHAICLLPVG